MELAYGMHSFVSSFFHSVWCFLRSFVFRRLTAAQYSTAQIHPYLFIHLQVYGHLDFSRLRKLWIKLISTFTSISFIFKCSFHLRQSFAVTQVGFKFLGSRYLPVSASQITRTSGIPPHICLMCIMFCDYIFSSFLD